MQRIILLIALISLLLFGCSETQKIDLIVHNAKIYTVNETFAITEAMAIDKGKIIAIGAENEIKNKYLAKEYIDAKKQAVFPGFIDAHCHFYHYAALLQELNLNGTTSFNEMIEKIVAYSKTNSYDWILGTGWDQNDWETKEFPTKDTLDKLFPNTPIFLTRVDGHAAIANQKALDLAKIDMNTTVNGGIVEKKNGKLTGILLDNALEKIKAILPAKTKEQLTKELLLAEQKLFEVGLTTIDEAGLNQQQIELIEELQQSNKLKLKVYAMVSSTEELLEYYLKKGPYKTDRLTVSSFKFYADGALGSRGACLLKPYSDITTHQHYGLMLHEMDFYEKYAPLLYEKGFQMNTHCIGDSANQQLFTVYKNVLKGSNDKRWRIEHAQVLDSTHFDLFSKYNIIPKTNQNE